MFRKRSLRRGKAKAKRTGKDHPNSPPGMPQPLAAHFLSLPIYTLICSLLLYKFPDWCVLETGHRSIEQNECLGKEAGGEARQRRKEQGKITQIHLQACHNLSHSEIEYRIDPAHQKSAPVISTTFPTARSNTEYA